MATTFVDYTGDGNATKSFSFPSYKVEDIKVDVDGVIKTVSTHYNITSYTTTGGGNVVFTSGNIPASPAAIRIYRDTEVDSPKATYTAGSSVKAGDLNNNHTQLLYAAQEEQNQTVITSRIKDAAVTTAKIKADNITSALIADDQINSEHYVDGSIDTAHIADSQITSAKIADGTIVAGDLASNAITTVKITDSNVTTAKIADSNVTTAKIADSNVTTAKIAADAVNGTKIADDSINSEHYVDGSIDTAHIADSQVTTAKIADANVTTAKITDANVTTAKIADSNVTTAKIAADSITSALIADDSINSEHYVDGSIDEAHLSTGSVTTAKLGTNSITTAKIAAGQVTLDKLADASVNTDRIIDANVTTAKIASNAVTTDKIADGELTTLAGMQSGTASKLADSTALTADIADLNQIDGLTKQTTISDSDASFPTSGAVVDYVAAQIAPLGGLEVIATEVAFPNTQPSSGVVISISDAGGVVFNGSGTSTTGRTVGGSTVTINNAPSSLNSETLVAGVGLMVSSTGSSQTYNYHKILGKEDDIKQLSDDINDFNARYRVGSSNPTSALDAGDLFFNTSTQKLLVYNSTNSAWEEAQSIGNFFISTFSEAFDGSRTQFTLSNAPTNVQQVLLSLNGVVQKPGTAFTLSGSTVTLASAPASGTDYFAVVMGSTVNIGTPSNNTVSTAVLQNGSVTTAKIADNAVTMAKLDNSGGITLPANIGVVAANMYPNAIVTSNIADDAVTAAKIADGTVTAAQMADDSSPTRTIQNSAVTTAKIADDAVTAAKITTNAVGSTELANNAVNTVNIADDAVTAAKLANTSVTAASYGSSTSIPSITVDAQGRITAASGNTVNTDLVGDSSPQLGGNLDTNGNKITVSDNQNVEFGASGDLYIKHSSGHNANFIVSYNGDIEHHMTSSKKIIKGFQNSGTPYVALYQDGNKRLETTSGGVTVTGTVAATQFTYASHPGHTAFTGNNSTTTITILSGHNVNSVLVVYNGLVLTPTTDYTISGTTLTLQFTPPTNAQIIVRYLPN